MRDKSYLAVLAVVVSGCQGVLGEALPVGPDTVDPGIDPVDPDGGLEEEDAGQAMASRDVPTSTTDRGAPTTDRGAPATDRGAPAVDVPPTGGDPCLPFRGSTAPVSLTTTGPRELRAFPGAEGFGAAARGGRGGRVIYVTNLNASGPGSFQDAVQQTGPRYVLFKVSGVVQGEVHVRSGDLTIAGQTSPGGVTVRGFHTTEQPY
ncbi:MAG: hypothetical protein KA978_02495, partial [Deltaproteobacteria bacterium]|nr:hypothetical protein [Deltaproteobacteria bacterium]